MILEILLETTKRTAGIALVVIPLLLIVEWANHRYGDRLIKFFEKRNKFMPFWAALLSVLPGCNVAAAVALLFSRGLVSMGSLIAAMIATSDEAIYVFIPQKFNFLPLFGAKLILAILAGLSIDFFSKKISSAIKKDGYKLGYCCSIHEHVHTTVDMLKHVLKHGIKIIFYIFIVLFLFNYIKDVYGLNTLAGSFIATKNLQPILAGFFGLLPGCGTSVVLATLYTQGILTFGGALSGLAVASGDTILVLLANKVKKEKIFLILLILLFVGIISGYIANII